MAGMTDRSRVAVELSKLQLERIRRALGAARQQIVWARVLIDDSEQLLAGMRAPGDTRPEPFDNLQSPSR